MDETPKSETSKQSTEDSNLELLAKSLDEKLKRFVDNLEKKPYTDGWKEETWREEMEQHPFFMSKPINPEDKPSPLIEGLQNLRYDPEDNTPENLATKYKEDGNYNFKERKYQLAIMSYNEALKLKFQNNQLRAQMLNNLSASHFYLKNFRSSLKAADDALKLMPDYAKTIKRAIHCCINMIKFENCLKYCEKYLELVPGDKEVLEIKKNATRDLKTTEMERRKRNKMLKEEEIRKKMLLVEINKRHYNIIGIKSRPMNDLSAVTVNLPFPLTSVHMVEKRLVWPVVMLYPEYGASNYIDEFHEDTTFYDSLKMMLTKKQEWDVEGRFTADTVNIYCQFVNTRGVTYKMIKLNPICTLSEALGSNYCPIECGVPAFTILFAGGDFEKNFIKTLKEQNKY